MRILGVIVPFLFLAALLSQPVALAADTAITVENVSPDTASPLGAGVALQDGDPYINYVEWPAGDIFLKLNATAIGTGANDSPSFTIMHGDNPPAWREDLGNLTISVPANRVYIIGPLESARFINESGYLQAFGTNITTATISLLRSLNG